MRIPAIEAAKQFVSSHFPDCSVAILTGSTSRGEDTHCSDLDIVVISETVPSAYIEAFHDYGWMIEVLMHTRDSYKAYFEQDRLRGRPSLPHMFSEGIVLVDDGTAAQVQQEARTLLAAGPPEWTQLDIQRARYLITNLVLDLEGGLELAEAWLTVGELAVSLHELVLRANGCWTGKGKRIVRLLEQFDPVFARRFADTFRVFHENGDLTNVIDFADSVLAEFGGRLFEGFCTMSR